MLAADVLRCGAQASFWSDLAEGWHELAIRPWYWINLIAHACWNFAIPAYFVLGPVIAARSLGGASAWGAITARSSARPRQTRPRSAPERRPGGFRRRGRRSFLR